MERDDERGAVTRIFLAARDLTPSARPSFLEEACKGDAELRRDVESLLAHDETTLVAATIVDPPPSIPGYRVLQKIGEGGMGEVWLARQDEPVQRDVAIKVIKAGMDTKHVVARFEAERQALALMEHPSIAKIFAAGETSRGLPYFVMEYVRGESLTAYADRHQLSLDERLALFVEVCEAVQHAHQKGVVHRDLKPSNVLVTLHGRRPTPKIIDFGVAKATAQRLTERSLFTELGTLIGTPEYMSPEQAELTGLDVDARTDVYSLGVILYELLVGTLPFDSRELRAAGFDEIRRRIREDEPATPSSRLHSLSGAVSVETAHKRRTEPTSLRRQLRGDLDWIAMRALEKDRTRRYQSAADLAAEIERHQRNEPVVAGPPSVVYKLGKFVRRHRAAVAAGLVVTASAAALVIAAAFWLPRQRGESRSEPIQKQLTSNPPETAVHTAAISPDGKQLAYADPTGTYLRVIQTGETRRIVTPEAVDVTGIVWFSDGTRVAITAISPNQQGVSAWTLSVVGGTPRKLRDNAIAGQVSPDGSQLLFFNLETHAQNWFQSGLWVMRPDGEGAHVVLPKISGNDYKSAAWSLDGKRILFVRASDDGTRSIQAELGVSDLTGSSPKVLLSDPQLFFASCSSNAAWLPDGRILFTRAEPPPNQTSSNFWELRIDPTTNTPMGEARRLTNWADSCVTDMDAPPDGSHLAFLRQHRQSDVYLGELRDNGDRLDNVRRLTLDNRDDFASGWTSDSRALYVVSNRQGSFDIFKQGVDGSVEAVVQGPGNERKARLSPDGAFLFYVAQPPGRESGPVSLMRVAVSGGAPETLLTQDEIAGFVCPRISTASCILKEYRDGRLSFFSFDPVKGKGREIGSMPTGFPVWSLSPDGSRIALIGDETSGGPERNGIVSMNVSDGTIADPHVAGKRFVKDLAWSADGKSLFVTDLFANAAAPGWRVIHVDFAGNARILWQTRIVWGQVSNPSPSPDGRYLAFERVSFESNAWTLENF